MAFTVEKGVLYVVPTPIGNLGDVSERALKVLAECDFIAAEDTRVTRELLRRFGLKTPLVSYREHNKRAAGAVIVERIKNRQSCALVSDAGTPAISDPGEQLVALCVSEQIPVVALPGPCAAVTAVSAAGLPSRRFCFEGFLPDKKIRRGERLTELKNEKRTMVFYISPHDLEKTLADLRVFFGARNCALAKEISKINEKYFRGTVNDIAALAAGFDDNLRKGEFVLIIEGAADGEAFWKSMDIERHYEFYIDKGFSAGDACKQTAKDRKIPKNQVYSVVLKNKEQ